MTKYKDGKLIYASVEPGLYHVSFSDAVENKDFTKVKNLNQLLKLNQSKPVPYSVAQMNYEALPVTNVSILVKGEKEKDEKADSNYLAYFNFSPVKYDKDKNHEVVSVNGAPFESAQADFGNYAYVAMKSTQRSIIKYPQLKWMNTIEYRVMIDSHFSIVLIPQVEDFIFMFLHLDFF